MKSQKKLLFYLFFFFAVFLFVGAEDAFAANWYVRAGASGNGSDWTNAYGSLPSSLTRGDTYYVADGNYPGYSFDDAQDGTKYITIKKAIQSDHGIDTGWLDNYGDGQAIFQSTCTANWVGCSSLVFRTGYWILDGSIGSGSNIESYGFLVPSSQQGSYAENLIQLGKLGYTDSVSHVTIRHLAVTCAGPSINTGQRAILGGSDVNLQNVFVDNCQNSIAGIEPNWLIENSYFGRAWSSPLHHGEQINSSLRADGTIFRNNVLAQCEGTTCIGNYPVKNWDIYNNIFMNVRTGNGIVGASGNDIVENTRIYGNTIINSGSPIIYQNNPNAGFGSGNVVKNNFFYNSNGAILPGTGGLIDHDYNVFFNSTSVSTETHGQVLISDPLVKAGTGDFHLKFPTDPGLSLGTPYNKDKDGNTRGTDGVWDRGAYEYGSSGGPVVINGQCGTAQNTCTAGALSDTADSATQYLWQCVGLNGGGTASCSLPRSTGNTYYVATNGNDTNTGTLAMPFRTIQKAADIVGAGDTVIVRDGVYMDTDGDDIVIYVKRGGSASAPVIFRSENKWGAVIDGTKAQGGFTGYGVSFVNNVNYVTLEGFEIRNLNNEGININEANSNIVVRENHIHDIGRVQSYILDGKDCVSIGSRAQHITVERNLIHTCGRLNPNTTPSAPESSCTTPSNYTYNGVSYPNEVACYNHDHGIYIRGDYIDVINNIFYDMKSGWGVQSWDDGSWKEHFNIVGNTFADPNPRRDGHIILGPMTNDVKIEDNIFYNPTAATVRLRDGCATAGLTNITIRNNLASVGNLISGVDCGYTIQNNLLNQNIGFVNVTGRDYHTISN